MANSKKIIDEPVQVILDAEAALCIAGETLERAADIAEKTNDTDAMMKIAAGWMEIHEYLNGSSHAQAEKTPIGFSGRMRRELDDAVGEQHDTTIEPDDEEYAAEGKRKSWLYP